MSKSTTSTPAGVAVRGGGGGGGPRTGRRRRALLFEQLPYVKFKGSTQGVLFLIFSNGDGE